MPNADSPTNPSVAATVVKNASHKAVAAVVVAAEADTADMAAEVMVAAVMAVADTAVDARNAKCTKPPAHSVAPKRPCLLSQLPGAPFSVAIAFGPAATSAQNCNRWQDSDPRRNSKLRRARSLQPVIRRPNTPIGGAVEARRLGFVSTASRSLRIACRCMAIAVLFASVNSTYAISPALQEAIPRDHLAYIASDRTGQGASDDSSTGPPPLVAIGADLLHRFGGRHVNQSAVSATLDVLSSLARLAPYPFAVVVTDASAKRLGPDSFRLNELQAAAIIETGGDNARITQDIQDLLTRWTSRDSARITSKDEFDSKVHTLIDDRLPDWCVIKWGAIKRFYVVAIGHRGFNDAAQSILRAGEHATDETKVQHWRELLGSRTAHFELQINFDAIKSALATIVKGRTQDVLDELGFADCSLSMWTVASKNRAVICTCLKIINGEEVLIPISTEAHGIQSRLIPSAATEYTLFRCNLGDVINRSVNAYLASRRQEVRDSLQSHWATFETNASISIKRDLFNHLDDIILVHNDPPHPLNLPLLSTIVIPIAGDPATVNRSLTALLNQSNRWFHNANTNPGEHTPTFAPQFTEADDHVWYLSFGFAGPAITVVDQFIIISHSPLACRQARDKLIANASTESKTNGK